MIGAQTTYNRWKRRRTIVVCAGCGKDHPVGTRFCSACGRDVLLPAADYEKLQDAKFDHEQTELAEKCQRNAAIKRIQALRQATACGHCNRYFDPPAQFCTSCGADIAHQLLADETIYAIVQPEFPRIIHSFDDYHGLRMSAPEKGVMRKLIFRTLFRFQRT